MKKSYFLNLIDKEKIITRDCLKVDKAITFFKSNSKIAPNPDKIIKKSMYFLIDVSSKLANAF